MNACCRAGCAGLRNAASSLLPLDKLEPSALQTQRRIEHLGDADLVRALSPAWSSVGNATRWFPAVPGVRTETGTIR